jgi:cyclopropane fatty-acyl-phospholipid synthase-like methyltransferase
MANSIKQLLQDLAPVAVKNAVKRSSYFEVKSARRLAATSKRIDICSAQIAHFFHLASHRPVRDLVCLEVGSGWVLTHALVFHLLGAKKVIATDIDPHAHPSVLRDAVKHAVAPLPRDVLAPFADHSFIRERFDNLLSIRKFDFEVLKSLGIEYVSPVDLARKKLDTKVDFIYSLSVMEHVPCDDVAPLLANLAEMLSPGGTMLHAIHLEDHRDFGDPFAFLSIPADSYPRRLQTNRGNRLRGSEWNRLFSQIPGTSTKTLYTYHRRDRALPREIDGSVRHVDEEDLRVSHVGTLTQKLL